MNNVTFLSLFYVFIGGGLGSIARFLASLACGRLFHVGGFPLGTFLVNILGCFFIGMFSAYFIRVDSPAKFLFITGFCGGFTTFSTFASENYTLWQEGRYLMLAFYALASIILGVLAVAAGFQANR